MRFSIDLLMPEGLPRKEGGSFVSEFNSSSILIPSLLASAWIDLASSKALTLSKGSDFPVRENSRSSVSMLSIASISSMIKSLYLPSSRNSTPRRNLVKGVLKSWLILASIYDLSLICFSRLSCIVRKARIALLTSVAPETRRGKYCPLPNALAASDSCLIGRSWFLRKSMAISVVKMAVNAMRIRNWWGLEGDSA
ncbi:MAG: hypothetical protein OXC57_11245 [Rhodobacteraceae bacterium]|nr:hypothetical protein [Paracoccaceae bacterium]